MIALRSGGGRAAAWSELNPLKEIPIIPTARVHQDWAASQAIISTASSRMSPSESPVPR